MNSSADESESSPSVEAKSDSDRHDFDSARWGGDSGQSASAKCDVRLDDPSPKACLFSRPHSGGGGKRSFFDGLPGAGSACSDSERDARKFARAAKVRGARLKFLNG